MQQDDINGLNKFISDIMMKLQDREKRVEGFVYLESDGSLLFGQCLYLTPSDVLILYNKNKEANKIISLCSQQSCPFDDIMQNFIKSVKKLRDLKSATLTSENLLLDDSLIDFSLKDATKNYQFVLSIIEKLLKFKETTGLKDILYRIESSGIVLLENFLYFYPEDSIDKNNPVDLTKLIEITDIVKLLKDTIGPLKTPSTFLRRGITTMSLFQNKANFIEYCKLVIDLIRYLDPEQKIKIRFHKKIRQFELYKVDNKNKEISLIRFHPRKFLHIEEFRKLIEKLKNIAIPFNETKFLEDLKPFMDKNKKIVFTPQKKRFLAWLGETIIFEIKFLANLSPMLTHEMDESKDFRNVESIKINGNPIFNHETALKLNDVIKKSLEGKQLLKLGLKLACEFGCNTIFQLASIIEFINKYLSENKLTSTSCFSNFNNIEVLDNEEFTKLSVIYRELYNLISREQAKNKYIFPSIQSGIHHYYKHGRSKSQKLQHAEMASDFYKTMQDYFTKHRQSNNFKRIVDTQDGICITLEFNIDNIKGILIFRKDTTHQAKSWEPKIERDNPFITTFYKRKNKELISENISKFIRNCNLTDGRILGKNIIWTNLLDNISLGKVKVIKETASLPDLIESLKEFNKTKMKTCDKILLLFDYQNEPNFIEKLYEICEVLIKKKQENKQQENIKIFIANILIDLKKLDEINKTNEELRVRFTSNPNPNLCFLENFANNIEEARKAKNLDLFDINNSECEEILLVEFKKVFPIQKK